MKKLIIFVLIVIPIFIFAQQKIITGSVNEPHSLAGDEWVYLTGTESDPESCENEEFQWLTTASGTKYMADDALDIAVDALGNSYITGYFTDQWNMGGKAFTSAGGTDIFVAKLDVSGNPVWAVQAGGEEDDQGIGIAVDASGIYVTGFFRLSVAFDGTTLNSIDDNDLFLAKYDHTGNLLWIEQVGGQRDQEGHAVTVDPSGNISVTGCFDMDATFGNITLNAFNGIMNDIFVAQYNSSGQFLWVNQFETTEWGMGCGIVSDDSGNLYVTGYYTMKAVFDAIELTVDGWDTQDLFLAKLDAFGNVLWAIQGYCDYEGIGHNVAVDKSGNSYIAGDYKNHITLAGQTIEAMGDNDIFLAKFNDTGECLWVWTGGGDNTFSNPEHAYGVTVNEANQVFITGNVIGGTVFGDFTFVWGGLFIAKFDDTGNQLWVKTATGDAS